MDDEKKIVETDGSAAAGDAAVVSEPKVGVDLNGEIEKLKSDIAAIKADSEARRTVSSIDGGAGRTAEQPITKEMLSKMKPSEISELEWAEVRRVLAA